jgi:hypothetical protein
MMLVPIEMPELGMAVVSARVTAWYKRDGEPVAFGEVICEITPHERGHRDRDRDAARMISAVAGDSRAARSAIKRVVRKLRRIVRLRRSRKRLAGQDQRVGAEFRLIASETGTMSTIKAGVGSIIGLGEVLAIVDLPFVAVPGEATPARMRIVPELIDRAGEGAT